MFAIPLLCLTLLAASPPAWAESPTSARQAAALQRQATEAWSQGQLELAASAARSAIEADEGPGTLPARRVLFELCLLHDDLRPAQQQLDEIKKVGQRDAVTLTWTERAASRLDFERAERRGDLQAADQALGRLRDAGLRLQDELAWLERAEALRAVWSKVEANDLVAAGQALEAAEILAPARERMEGRLSLLEAARSCEADAVGAIRSPWSADTAPELALWASVTQDQGAARVASTGDGEAALDAALDRLEEAKAKLTEKELSWVGAAGRAREVERACEAGEADRVVELQAELDVWLKAEPGCAWVEARTCETRAPGAASWARAGLRLGGDRVDGWWAEDNEQIRSFTTLAAGLEADGWLRLGGPLGLRGSVAAGMPLTLGEPPDGAPSKLWWDTFLGAGWSGRRLGLSAGALVGPGRLVAPRCQGTGAEEQDGVTCMVIGLQPGVAADLRLEHLALSLRVGGKNARATAAFGAYARLPGKVPLVIGLSANERWSGHSYDAENSQNDTVDIWASDFRAALVIGVDWRRS